MPKLTPAISHRCREVHALPSFWKCYHQLPQQIQNLADKNFALFKANPRHPSLGFGKKAPFTPSKSAAAIALSLGSATAITTGFGSAVMKNTIGSASSLRPRLSPYRCSSHRFALPSPPATSY